MNRLIQDGPRDARIVAVGEAPGQKEDEQGKPFIGASGELLSRIFDNVNKQVGRRALVRSEIFITNVAHTRPPGNDFSKFLRPKPAPELLLGILQLKKDLDEIKPNLVIAFGDVPMRFLTGKHGITKWRGSILESVLRPGQKVIATYHPASAFRIYENKAIIEFDLAKCAAECASPEIVLPKRDFFLDPPRESRDNLIRELLSAEWLSIDIECVPRSDGTFRITCVGFSDRADRALVIPIRGDEDLRDVGILCGSDAKKVFQNGQFDIAVLEDNGIRVNNYAWDTMYAHHALLLEAAGGTDEVKALTKGRATRNNPFAKGLAFQTSIYTNEPYYKDDGKLWQEEGDIRVFWTYNAKDAAVTREIKDVQAKDLEAFGGWTMFNHEMRITPVLYKIGRRGVRIDLAKRDALRKKYETEIENLQNFMDAGAGKSINVKSKTDVHWLLYQKLGLPVQYHRETKQPTADKEAIFKLAGKYKHPLLMAIVEIRERRDFIERYLDARVDSDGRYRYLFDPSGTRTGRLASRGTIYGTGGNIQNIPTQVRSMFLADPGKVLIYADLSQAEARVVAYLARCEALIDLFNSGKDIHRENARLIYRLPLEQVSDERRYTMKRIIHASNYGLGVDKGVAVVNSDSRETGITVTHKEFERGQSGYFMLYPEIKEVWWHEVEQALRYTRQLTTPLGWKRTFYGRWDEKFLHEAYSFVPQSVVGILTQMAMPPVDEIPGCEILSNQHDALLCQCDEERVLEVTAMIQTAMHIPVEIYGKTLTIPTDAKVGRNWQEASDDNPDGLVKIAKWPA